MPRTASNNHVRGETLVDDGTSTTDGREELLRDYSPGLSPKLPQMELRRKLPGDAVTRMSHYRELLWWSFGAKCVVPNCCGLRRGQAFEFAWHATLLALDPFHRRSDFAIPPSPLVRPLPLGFLHLLHSIRWDITI